MIKSIYIPIIVLLVSGFQFKVFAQQNDSINEFLKRSDSIILLDMAVVESYQVNEKLWSLPGNIALLNTEDLKLGDGIGMVNILNSIPGVNMQSGTYSTNRIVIRGMGSRTPYNSNRIRAYLNEIPLTSSDEVSTPEEIDLHSLEKTEIIKGPSSALYGSGLGGSINMYTHSISSNEGKGLAQYGSFNTSKILVSGGFKSKNNTTSASLSNTNSNGYRDNNAFNKTMLVSTAEWKIKNLTINSTLLLIDLNAGIPSSLGETMFETQPQSAAPSWKAIGGFEKYRKAIVGINIINKFNEKASNQLTLFGKWNNAYEKRPFNNLDDQTGEIGFRNKLSIQKQKMNWVFGAEFLSEVYEWKLDINDSIINRNKENRNHLNLFGMAFYKPAPKINISLAMALNYVGYKLSDLYPENGDQSGNRKFPLIFSPKLGINYMPAKGIALYASAGHGFSLPSPEETLLPEGEVNTEIMPEQGMQYEIGSRINLLKNRIELEGSLYWIELKNLLVTKRISEDIFTGVNAGRTRHQGFEFNARASLLRGISFPGKLSTTISYAATINRFINFIDDGNTYDDNYLPGIPNQTAFFQIIWEPVKILSLQYNILYNGKQYLNDSNSNEYDSYFISNFKINAEIKLKKKRTLGFYFGINNLLNKHYASMLVVNAIGFGNNEPRYYYPGLPRNIYGGVQFLF
jgi:iron complex outermembrane recepter protein